MVYSDYVKLRMLSMHQSGYKFSTIVEYLILEDQVATSKQGVRQFLQKFYHYNTIARKPGSGIPPKLSPSIQGLIETSMQEDDKTTATQLQSILAAHNVYVSLATIV